MSLTDIGTIARAASSSFGRMLLDALGDVSGKSMPYKAEVVATPEVLSRLINEGAVQPFSRPVELDGIEVQDIPSVSSNCRNLVLSLQHQSGPELPDSAFLKLPMESAMTRWFFGVIKSWQLESHFFRHVAGKVPLRTPITYATASQGTRFFLLQENLNADDSVQLFVNFDMHEGPSLELVKRCLDAFARLHSSHYGMSQEQRYALIPEDLHLFLSPSMGAVSRTLNSLGLKPCMKKHPGLIPEEVVQAYRLSVENWDKLLGFWFADPLSLLHGDSHLGNFFVSGEEMGMLDWQAAHWGKGIRDVQYFLNNSVPESVLAQHERELVRYYVERRGVHGEAIDEDRTWQEYRSFTFHALFTIVVSIGFGALNEEQDALMEEILRRSVASVQRAGYADWLQDFLAKM
jgi:Ecdysteroid kinase-like family